VTSKQPFETVVMNTLTVNLHLMMISFYRPAAGRWKILMEDSAFPSDNYAVHSHLASRGLDPDEGVLVIGPRTGEMTLRTEDVESVLLARGSEIALVLLPGQRHRGAAPFARDLSFYWIHFVPRSARGHRVRLRVSQYAKVSRPECVAELFHRFLDDQEAKRLDPLYAGLLLLQILCEIVRQPDARKAARGAALAGRAETYVTRHLTEKLSTARIAAALRVNPDYLNRVFRDVQGATVTEYIQRRRLTDAAGMLRDSADTVSEIAAACGYPALGHFRRLFRRFHGVSPAAYRRLMARAFVNAMTNTLRED